MAEIVFDTAALTKVRFAISPTIELVRSVAVLENPGGQAVHMPWALRTATAVGALDLSMLRALQGSEMYNPDFIHPLPAGPFTSIEDDLATMLATPGEQVRAEVLEAYPGERVPRVLDGFVEEPRVAVGRLGGLMRAYWRLALAPHWERVRALLEHDIRYRARQMADGGLEALFADLDQQVSWSDGVLRVARQPRENGVASPCETLVLELDERGLLLIPSVFAWPKVLLVSAEPWQPTMIYPARGVGMLWDQDALAPPDALAKLVGRNRAAVLLALDSPRSTGELAGLLGVTSGGVSQQLSVLAQAGLVTRQRVRRHVLYLRTAGGDTLVNVTSGAEALVQPAA
jgi:DNA-binding transcriptional ArsR family regulator